MSVIDAAFGVDTADVKVTVMQAMRAAWMEGGLSLADWANGLGITAAAAEAYITGINTPCADILILAMGLSGWPLAAELRAWIDRHALRHPSRGELAKSRTRHANGG